MYIEEACLCAECDWVFELDKFNRCPRCMSSQYFFLVDFFPRKVGSIFENSGHFRVIRKNKKVGEVT
jgi:hypothetical protein